MYITPDNLLATNSSRVGRDTINNSEDMKMKSEMPKSLAGIEKAAESLQQASTSLKSDPYSQVMIRENKYQFSHACLLVLGGKRPSD